MLLSNRTVLTNADLPKMMPILQEMSSICKANDIPLHVWVGGNGYIAGTLIFTVGYESGAAYGKFMDTVSTDSEWIALWAEGVAKQMATPTGNRLSTLIEI